MENQRIRIKLQAYDHRLLDQAVKDIINATKATAAKVIGPVPLPTKIERYSVNRSPHVNKESMDQFEIRIHKRLIDIIQPSIKTVDELKKLNLSAGIDISIKLK